MTSSTGTVVDADALRRRHDALVAELRDVDHWRRLVSARLDLAVAAVTSIDDLPLHALRATPALPHGLRDLVGLPPCDQALPEAGSLTRLRAVLRDLDAYTCELQTALRAVAAGLGPDAGADEPSDQPPGDQHPGHQSAEGVPPSAPNDLFTPRVTPPTRLAPAADRAAAARIAAARAAHPSSGRLLSTARTTRTSASVIPFPTRPDQPPDQPPHPPGA
jgi:hypothetical protein